MNIYDVDMPGVFYGSVYIRDIHARNPEEAKEKAVEHLYTEGFTMTLLSINESEFYEENAIPRIVEENISKTKPDIEE